MTYSEPRCELCREPVDPTEAGTYRRLTGWVKVRSGGGGNALRLAGPPEAFAHGYCIDRKARGASVQTELVL